MNSIEEIKPGLYFLGVNDFEKKQISHITFDLIYIISVENVSKEKNYFHESWKGIEFNYYSFSEKKILQFNSYWTDYIQSLEPINNEKTLDAAKKHIQSIYNKEKEYFDKMFKELNLLPKI
jgi:hypothetical protein